MSFQKIIDIIAIIAICGLIGVIIFLIWYVFIELLLFNETREDDGYLETFGAWEKLIADNPIKCIVLFPLVLIGFLLDFAVNSIITIISIPSALDDFIKDVRENKKHKNSNENTNNTNSYKLPEPTACLNANYYGRCYYTYSIGSSGVRISILDNNYNTAFKEVWCKIKDIYKREELYKSSLYTIETIFNSLAYIYENNIDEFITECNKASTLLKLIIDPVIKAEKEQSDEAERLKKQRVNNFMNEYHNTYDILKTFWEDNK